MKYYVWKLNTGYVSVSTYMPQQLRTPCGKEVTFELLKTFDDWKSAISFVESQRNES